MLVDEVALPLLKHFAELDDDEGAYESLVELTEPHLHRAAVGITDAAGLFVLETGEQLGLEVDVIGTAAVGIPLVPGVELAIVIDESRCGNPVRAGDNVVRSDAEAPLGELAPWSLVRVTARTAVRGSRKPPSGSRRGCGRRRSGRCRWEWQRRRGPRSLVWGARP